MGEGERSIQNLSLPEKALDFFSNEWGIKQLHPPVLLNRLNELKFLQFDLLLLKKFYSFFISLLA